MEAGATVVDAAACVEMLYCSVAILQELFDISSVHTRCRVGYHRMETLVTSKFPIVELRYDLFIS